MKRKRWMGALRPDDSQTLSLVLARHPRRSICSISASHSASSSRYLANSHSILHKLQEKELISKTPRATKGEA